MPLWSRAYIILMDFKIHLKHKNRRGAIIHYYIFQSSISTLAPRPKIYVLYTILK
jgi:hypothetical protein